MLDQLIESTSHAGENKKRGGYILTTLTLIFSLFLSGIMWSMFAKDLGIGNESLELSELVAPVAPPETVPPPKQEIPKQANPQNSKSVSDVPVIKVNMQNINESPTKPPIEISTARNNSSSRPVKGEFRIGPEESSASGNGNQGRTTDGGGSDTGVKASAPSKQEPEDIEPPKIKKPEPTPTPVPAKPPTQSLGVITGRATYLPKPIYSAAAKAVRAAGAVSVQVTVDESGNVISAKAINGHPLLRADSEAAARKAKFDPTYLSKQPVKVTGVIVYNFNLQ